MPPGLLNIDRFLGKSNQLDPVSSAQRLDDVRGEAKRGVFQTSLVNFDVTNDNKLRTRKGHVKVVAGDVHSLSLDAPGYFVMAGDLCRVDFVNSTEETVSYFPVAAVTPGKQHRMFYLSLADRLFYSSDTDSGVVLPGSIRRPWGIINPTLIPTLVAGGGGSLYPGTYTLTYTYVSEDGRESGADGEISISIPDVGGSIAISGIGVSSDPAVTQKNVYVSESNGTQMYFFATIDNATTSITFYGDIPPGAPISTMYKTPPPLGGPLTFYKGRVYVASGQHLFISDPLSYELFGESFISMETTISMIRAVNDGIYVGDEKGVHFLGGTAPDDFKFKTILNYRAIPYSDVAVEESERAPGALFVFCTEKGVCFAGDGGEIKNMTYATYHFPPAQWAAPMLRLDEDAHQYVVVLHEPGAVENEYSGPVIPKTVINNF